MASCLNEEHRNIVANEIPIAFLGVEFHGKAADVAPQVRRPLVLPATVEKRTKARVFSPACWKRSALVMAPSEP
jgi:hypothetical protein